MSPVHITGNDERYVFLIEGDFIVENDIVIDRTTNSGMVFLINGNLYVKPGVTTLDGVYIVNGVFHTETGGIQRDETLTGHGMWAVVGTGKFELMRDRKNNPLGGGNDQPSEKVDYAPKYLVLFGDLIGETQINIWKER